MLRLTNNRYQAASKPSAKSRARVLALFTSCLVLLALLSGCGSSADTGSQAQKGDTGQSLAAVTEPTSTVAPLLPTATTASFPSSPSKSSGAPTPTTPESQAASGTDAWTLGTRTLGAVTFSYRYPPTWSPDLVYCPSGGTAMGSHLPPGCASTDFLVGQKAADVASSLKGTSTSPLTPFNVGDLHAVKQFEKPFDASKAAGVYTVLVYGKSGAPLFGFVTYMGAGTKGAEQGAILTTLDGVTSTLSVSK